MSEWPDYMGLELNILPHLAALLFAYALALPIAWGRERNERSAGLKTFDTAIVLSIATFATLRLMTNFKSDKNEPTILSEMKRSTKIADVTLKLRKAPHAGAIAECCFRRRISRSKI